MNGEMAPQEAAAQMEAQQETAQSGNNTGNLQRDTEIEQDIAGIGWAVKQLRNGKKVFRLGWNGKGMNLTLQTPDQYSLMTEPYIYLFTTEGGLIPWTASQADVLATDWEVTE